MLGTASTDLRVERVDLSAVLPMARAIPRRHLSHGLIRKRARAPHIPDEGRDQRKTQPHILCFTGKVFFPLVIRSPDIG